jgi:GDP-L-fucose synthase
MRILVTGGGGFLGSHLVDRLRESGEDPFVPRRADYDLTRWDDAERLFGDAKPELVYHLAAEVGGIGANRANPGRYWYANLMMGAHVLELARQHATGKVVLAGTVCAYPKFTPVPFHEQDLWNGYPEETNAPYGIAKLAQLVQMQANRAQHGQSAIYLMPTNLYGPGDKFNPAVSHVIPALIKTTVDAKEAGADHIVVWGTGAASREFLFIDDAAEGVLLGAEHYDDGEPVNLGANRELPIRELVGIITRHLDFAGEVRWDTSKPDGQPRRGVDGTRAAKEFGFRARVDFDDGLQRTIDWYLAHRAEAEVRTV